MKKHRSIKWSIVAALAAVGLTLAGCSSDTCTCPDGVDDLEYPDQSTPNNVISKLEMAYEEMDAEAYFDCLAGDFIFFLNPDDTWADPTLPEYWSKAEEQRVHESMFADTTVIESIELTLAVVSTDSLPGEDPVDPGDDLWEYEVDVDLRVVQDDLTYTSSGMSLFVMRRSPDHEDVVWQLIEHHDLGEEEIQREGTTWTTIKLVFGGDVQDSLYPIRSTPDNVFEKLILAYVRMDAAAYLDCLAEDLIFFLNPDDVGSDPTLPDYWDKAEEETIHGNMFGDDTNIAGVMLTMMLATSSFDPGDPGDPLDDRWTYMQDIDLRVQLPPDLTLHAAAPCQFGLGVDPDEVGHGGRRLWEIRRWYDLDAGFARSGEALAEHESSWGRIKSLYR